MYIKMNVIGEGEFPFNVDIIADHLYVPWAIAFSEDGQLFFTERSGTIRMMKDGILQPQPLITFTSPFLSRGEGGLLGITLDPDFLQNHFMYVMYTYIEGSQIFNRVIRLVVQNNEAMIDKILIDSIPGGAIHNGGRLKIGPDRKLYITTGDAGNAMLAQDITNTAGKVLRIELDGQIPTDNPFAKSPIYCFGNRNPQGLAWNSNSIMYESEHGQEAHDEINIIRSGGNYGWPLVQGDEDSDKMLFQKPLLHSGTTTWAPSGIAFINQGSWQGKLLVANLRGEQLLAISLNQNGTGVERIESWLWNQYGRLREVIQAKDGSIYLTTSNRDGRGEVDSSDDKILRLIPKSI